MIRLLQDRFLVKPNVLLGVDSKSEHYKQVNDLANAIRKAAVLPNVETAVQCLIDASKPIIRKRDGNNLHQLLRDLVDIKINARSCADLADIEDHWFEADSNAFDQFIAQHNNLNSRQLEFLRLLKSFIIEREKIEKRDLIQSPFTVIHPQGIRGVFSPAEINEILALTESLAA